MTDDTLLQKIEEIIAPLRQYMQGMKQDMQDLKGEQQKQGKDLKYLKGKVNKINKTVDIIGKSYDERIVKNARDIAEVKEYIGFPPKH